MIYEHGKISLPQSLNLNVRFLIYFLFFIFFFWYSKYLLLCTKPPSSVQTARGNFLNFSSQLEETLMMRLITKEKYVLRFDFFHMISQSLNLSLFAIYKLIKRPLPPKRHEDRLKMRLITEEKYVLLFDFFDMISQSLIFEPFAIYKLIMRPLLFKRHGVISWIFPQN